MPPADPAPPGSTLGILGGGQLGRMLAMAAAELGIRTRIFAPPGDNPATDIAASAMIAEWNDEQALAEFADKVDAVTYEFENVPLETALFLAARKPLAPGANALAIAQDRVLEKSMARDLGLELAPFVEVGTIADLEAGIESIQLPAILKTRRLGYDGKGQVLIEKPTDAAAAWEAIGLIPAVLEERVAFEHEISALVARSADGAETVFDITMNHHENGILRHSRVPAGIDPILNQRAIDNAKRIARHLDYVGVLAVEMFVVGTDPTGLLLNEIAPRVHNSGHWTTDGCAFSQFDLHVRACLGWPLPPDPLRHSDVQMTNLLGDDAEAWRGFAKEPNVSLHLYGKASARPGRKMGHVNRVTPRAEPRR